MEFGVLIALAVLIEALIEYGKTVVQAFETGEKKKGLIQLISMILGVLVAFAFHGDAFALLGMEVHPIIGTLITGVILSRGSNYTSDLLKRITNPTVG